MSKTPETVDLEKRLRAYTNGQFGCDEVTIGPFGNERVDFISLDWKGTWRCFEIKVSKADFRSKAKKTFVGNLNYFVMPGELYELVKAEIAPEIGVLVAYGPCGLQSAKKATRKPLGTSESKLYTSMIRSLYRTYERVQSSGDEPIVNEYRRRISRMERERETERKYTQDAMNERERMKLFLRRKGIREEFEQWVEAKMRDAI